MTEYNFYEYNKDIDQIKIFSEDIYNYFEENFKIIIDSIDFDQNQNVVLYIEDLRNSKSSELEKYLLKKIEHLNDIEIRDMKIILTFDCTEIQLC